jgi:hypothetical protein
VIVPRGWDFAAMPSPAFVLLAPKGHGTEALTPNRPVDPSTGEWVGTTVGYVTAQIRAQMSGIVRPVNFRCGSEN